MNLKDVVLGQKIGRLILLATGTKKSRLIAITSCECGKLKAIRLDSIGTRTFSCGCLQKEKVIAANTTHGMVDTPTYRSWAHMLGRTSSETNRAYKQYKDRKPPGSWRIFENFLKDMGECPEGLTLERIDNTKPYGPDNCEWASRAQQSKNREATIFVRFRGEIMSRGEAAKLVGISPENLNYKLYMRKLSLKDVFKEQIDVVAYAEFARTRKR